MMWSLVAGCGLALMLLVTGAGGQTTFGACQVESSTSYVCLACNPFFVLNAAAGTCQAAAAAAANCPANCATCPVNNTVCATCNPGYRLRNGACEQCLAPNCKVCHASCIDRCEECLPGFRRNKDYECDRCNGMCKNCTSSAAGCDECGPATYPDASATCSTCTVTNCLVCTSPSTCVQCKPAFFLSGGSCTACSGTCLACTSATTCSVCPAGSYKDTSGSTLTCTACHAECKTGKCDINSKCTECKAGWFLNGGSCTQRLNCQTAAADGKCAKCMDNYKLAADGTCSSCLDLTTKECHSCVESNRRRLWSDGLCQYCPVNCDKCNTTLNCQSCMSGFILNSTTAQCVSCPTTDSTLTTAECAVCSTSYFETTCKACPVGNPAGASNTACDNCNGMVYTQNCTSCEGTLPSGQTECNQCAAAKTGIYWSSTCMQYNCSNKNDAASCAACGVSNQLVQCRECPTNTSSLLEAECEQCPNGKWLTSGTARCLSTPGLDCSGNLGADEATCLYCNSHYYNNVTGTCQVCTGDLDQAACEQCPGRYWTTSCQTMTVTDCTSVIATTDVGPCNACNFAGKYYNSSGACEDLDCSGTTSDLDEQKCNACDGVMWNGTLCLDVTPAAITDPDSCRYFSGRAWDTNSVCNVIVAQVGQTLPGEVENGTSPTQYPALYRNFVTHKYEAAVCNKFDTAEECSQCTGQYWDGTDCKAVNCSGALNTQATCNACPKKYWTTSCQTVPACTTGLATAAECGACRFNNYYWDTTCKLSTCTNLENMASQEECNACEEVFWNTTSSKCTATSNVADPQERCEGYWARVFVNSACLFVTSKVGDTINAAFTTADPFVILGDRYFDDNGMIYRLPDVTASAAYQVAENWCRYSSNKYATNRYWAANGLLDSDCIDLAALGLCGTTDLAVFARNSNPTLCGKCPKFLWDGTTTPATCKAVACDTPENIKISTECAACGQEYVWETSFRRTAYCKKLTCSSDLLGSVARCTACSIPGSPKNLLSSPSECYACPTSNCDECTVQGCTKCKDGYVLNAVADTCTACTGSEVYDPATQTCKTCPSNCKLCTSSACTECKPGFILRGGNCISCVQTESDCRDCKSPVTSKGSRWDANASPSCIACPASCTECDATGCTTCLDGYYKDGAACKSCPAPKLQTSEAQCQECFKETYWVTGTGCNDCLVENCMTCSATDKCTTCVVGRYFKSSTMKCELCSPDIANCAECDNTGKCTKCDANYYLYNSGASCVSQDANCITQRDNTGCTLCKDGYYITGDTCTACQTGCAKCSEGSSCMMCNANYFMTPGRMCAKCIDNCDQCECNAKCDRCATGFCFDVAKLECVADTNNCQDCTVIGTTTTCIDCAQNYVKNVCPACTSQCTQCTAAANCQACQEGYLLVNDATCTVCTDPNCRTCPLTVGVCTDCKDNYFMDNGTCTQCALNCKMCKNATYCEECFGGYSKSGGVCSQCTSNCVDCKPECTTCADSNYTPDPVNKQCIPKPTAAPVATTPAAAPPHHHLAVTTLLMTLLLATMIII